MFKNKYIIGIVLAILTGFSSCADLDLAPFEVRRLERYQRKDKLSCV